MRIASQTNARSRPSRADRVARRATTGSSARPSGHSNRTQAILRSTSPTATATRGAGRVGLLAVALLLLATPATVRAEEPMQELARLQRGFESITRKVAPSVVGIRAHRRLGTGSNSQLVLVNGSGTIIDANGLILTNEHVIQRTHDIVVILENGERLPARVHAADARNDLAILKIDRSGLTAARICNWGRVARGQWTVVVGNPFGLGNDGNLSVSVGIVSNLGRTLPGLGEDSERIYNDMIQTTAEINPGNSGGPLFNLDGELMGVVTAMHTRSGGDAGAGFAIPMTPDRLQRIAQLKIGRPPYAQLGTPSQLVVDATLGDDSE